MSKSFTRTVPKNHGSERPSRVIFADVESRLDPRPDGRTYFTLFLWTAIYHYYRRGTGADTLETYSGTDHGSFWDMVESHTYERTKTYVVTHHLEVDFMPLHGFVSLQDRGWRLDKLISHGKVLVMWWKKGKRTLVIMNNGNLFDGSISMWGDIFGVPKLDMPPDTAPMSDWIVYCTRDTLILSMMWDYLLRFLDDHDLGNFKLSKAGLAMAGFRHRFMTYDIAIHNDSECILLERLSYKGGRFEALKIGTYNDGPYYNLDINSMYGYIELTCDLPYELRGYKIDPTLEEVRKRVKKYAVIVECEVCVDEPFLPIKIDGKIRYQSGTYLTYLTTPELDYALEHGYVRSVKRMAWYYKAKILHDFADYFLNLKDRYDREGNRPLRQFAKLYLNSLYGKFGQHGYEDKIVGDCDPDIFDFTAGYSLDKHERYTISRYGGKIHETTVTDVGYNTFVSIASHITAYGRLMLWHLIRVAGYTHVYHVATDSLIVDQVGYDRLQSYIDPHAPGKLKLETSFDSMTIKDVNDTVQGGTVKIKGIPKKATQVSENSYEFTQWPRLTTLMKEGCIDDYYTRTTHKTLHRDRFYQSLGVSNPDIREVSS